MRSSRRLLIASCLVVALFGITSRTPASAQDKPVRPEVQKQFEAALKVYNEGQLDQAAAALDGILKMDPTSREAVDLRERTDKGLLARMLLDPKVGPKVSLLLRKAEEQAPKIPRDAAAIAALIEKMGSDDIVTRSAAVRTLTVIGAAAVPQLLDAALSAERPVLGSRKVGATMAIRGMGPAAIPPLIVALRFAGDAEAARIADMVAESPDARSVPPLAAIAENSAKPPYLRKAASDALAAIISRPAPPPVKETPKGAPAAQPAPAPQVAAAEAYFLLGQRYYYADPALLEVTSDTDTGLWRWNAQGKDFAGSLVFNPVPANAYARLMASSSLLAGMEQKHASPDSLALYMCNNYMMVEEGVVAKDSAAELQAMRAVNESVGAEYLYLALGRALKDNNSPLARRCIEAIIAIGDPRLPSDNTCVQAMSYPDKFVRIESALAIVRLNPMGTAPGAEQAVRVMAAGLGAPVRPMVAILTAESDLYARLAKEIAAADMIPEVEKLTEDAVRRVRQTASPINVLVIDQRVEGRRTMALVESLVHDVRSAKLPIILLTPADVVERFRIEGKGKLAAVMSLGADPASVKIAVANAASTSSETVAAADVRGNVVLVRRVLKAIGELPAGTNYAVRDLALAAAGFLKHQSNDLRMLAVRAIGNLPQPDLRDAVYEIFVSSAEPVELRREAGAALQKLILVSPRMDPPQQAKLRSLTGEADAELRAFAIHALSLASIPLSEREAAVVAAAEKAAPQMQPASSSNPRETPETAVAEAIRLLEAKDYKSFIQEFMPPETLAMMLSASKMTVDALAKEIGEKAAPEMLQGLKTIKDVKPEITADGKKATFKLKEPLSGHDSLSLLRIDKFWYIADE